jgi:hypothetical protein
LNGRENGDNGKNDQGKQRGLWPFIVDVVRSYAAQDETKEKKRQNDIAERVAFWTMVTAWGTVGAAILAGVAALIFWNQLGTMQSQIDEQRIDFRLDQRPVLDVADAPVPNHKDRPVYNQIIPGHVAWNYTIKNFGKGAAFDVRVCPFIRVGGSRFVASNNGDSGENFEIVSTKFIWQTAIFPDSFTEDEIKVISDEEYGVVLKLIILYRDTFGSPYTSTICQSKLPNGFLTVGRCTGYPFIYLMDDTDKCETTYR